MSYHIYLADKKEKLLIDCGNVTENTFEEDYETYKNIKDSIFNLEVAHMDLSEIKVKDLNLADLKKLIDSQDTIEKLCGIFSRWMALEYRYMNEDINNKFNLVGEEKIGKFKGYKII